MSDNPILMGLNPDFLVKVNQLLNNCAMLNILVRVVQGLRTPLEQAKLWRQGRDIDTIVQQIDSLSQSGATYLSQCLIQAGAQKGPLVTKALPGLSWHNWGEAIDVMCFDSIGKPINAGTDPAYGAYQAQVKIVGLFPVGNMWSWDAGHCQFRKDQSPLSSMSLKSVNDQLWAKYPLPPTHSASS